jgi:hypothetical protein
LSGTPILAVVAGLAAGVTIVIALSAIGDQAVSSTILPPPPAAKISENDTRDTGLIFERVTRISDNTGMFIANPPALGVSESNVYVAWRDAIRKDQDSSSFSIEIMFRTSHDSGESFGNEIILSNNGSNLFPPQLATSENSVFVVWEGYDSSDQLQVFLRVSKDYGITFGETINLSKSTGSAREPQIVATGQNVYVVWEDDSPGNFDIFLASSPDHGATFSPPVNISNNPGDSHSPQITMSDKAVYIAWNDFTNGNSDILLMQVSSEDGNFGRIVNLSVDSDRSLHPRLAVVDRHIYVVWQTDRVHRFAFSSLRDEIMFRYSDDEGKSFSSIKRISLKNILDPIEPNIAAAGNNVYIVWAGQNTHRFPNIFFRSSDDFGNSFGNIVNLQNDLTDHGAPQIAATNHTVYVTWDNGGTADNQSFMISHDYGNTFTRNVIFMTQPTSIRDPKVVIINNESFLVWDIETQIYFATTKK